MKRMLMGIMGVAVTFSAPSFAEEKGKKGGHADTFADKKKEEKCK